MQTIKLQAHTGDDGVLRLELSLQVANSDLEVLVVVQPVAAVTESLTTQDLGWPAGFFERTYGSLRDVDFVPEPEGAYEVREEIP